VSGDGASSGIQGQSTCSGGQEAKPPEAGGILISHAKNKIETEKDRFT